MPSGWTSCSPPCVLMSFNTMQGSSCSYTFTNGRMLIGICEIPRELCTFYQSWTQFRLERDTSIGSWYLLIKDEKDWSIVSYVVLNFISNLSLYLFLGIVEQNTVTSLLMTLLCFYRTGRVAFTKFWCKRWSTHWDYREQQHTEGRSKKHPEQVLRSTTSAWEAATTAWGRAAEERWELPTSKEPFSSIMGDERCQGVNIMFTYTCSDEFIHLAGFMLLMKHLQMEDCWLEFWTKNRNFPVNDTVMFLPHRLSCFLRSCKWRTMNTMRWLWYLTSLWSMAHTWRVNVLQQNSICRNSEKSRNNRMLNT